MPQTDEKKIRSGLRSYERKLQQEKKKFGYYHDGGGKRYQVGPHYMLLGDNEGALDASSGSRRNSPTTPGSRGIFYVGASRCTVPGTRSARPGSS